MENKPTVTLAWAMRKRHIAIDGALLCKPKFGRIMQRGDSGYNSMVVSGIPDTPKIKDDTQYTHYDGIIPFKPINEIGGIIESSICKQCKRKYAKLFET